MVDLTTSDTRFVALPRRANSIDSGLGSQPIALAGVTLLVLVSAVASITLWRAYTGTSPEADRFAATFRQFQTRTAQVSEQLTEKTNLLESTQQESIDQLQQVQDQVLTMRRQLAAQQTENKRLSEQVSGLSETIDGLRQSYASARPSESDGSTVRRHRHRVHYVRSSRRARPKA